MLWVRITFNTQWTTNVKQWRTAFAHSTALARFHVVCYCCCLNKLDWIASLWVCVSVQTPRTHCNRNSMRIPILSVFFFSQTPQSHLLIRIQLSWHRLNYVVCTNVKKMRHVKHILQQASKQFSVLCHVHCTWMETLHKYKHYISILSISPYLSLSLAVTLSLQLTICTVHYQNSGVHIKPLRTHTHTYHTKLQPLLLFVCTSKSGVEFGSILVLGCMWHPYTHSPQKKTPIQCLWLFNSMCLICMFRKLPYIVFAVRIPLPNTMFDV